jgi:hypothetical protein
MVFDKTRRFGPNAVDIPLDTCYEQAAPPACGGINPVNAC